MTVARNRAIAKWVFIVGFTILVLWIASLLSGCSSPVIPKSVASRTVAYDGNEQNAGVLKVWPGKGALLTDRKKVEYDSLVRLYGRGTVGHPLTPPVVEGQGLTALRGRDEGFPLHATVWLIDAEHLINFLLFKEWQRQSRVPL